MATQVGLNQGLAISAVSQIAERVVAAEFIENITWIAWANADGVITRSLVRPFARNALVRQYTVRVGAERADRTTLANSGQVRLQEQSADSLTFVVDFGMFRTVSGVGHVGTTSVALSVASTNTICSLRAFRGDGFDNKDLFASNCGQGPVPVNLPFETLTNKVQLKVKTNASLTTLANQLYLQFPDLPSDLDVRINSGAPAWTASGVAQPNTRGWDATTHQIVDLTAALAALGGNPRDGTLTDATIVLTSRVPGLLTIEETAVDIAYLARIAFSDSSEELVLELGEEGERDIVLPLPAWVTGVQEVRFTMAGTLSAERILPPVGPPIAVQSAGSGTAYDLVLDVDHAGAVRLDEATAFAELVGLRLPLKAGADGAETRVVVYEGTGDSPTKPVEGGTTAPVDLPPAEAGASDVWTSFLLANPVKLDPAKVYWAVPVVGRGGAGWSLGRGGLGGEAPAPVRRGAANGPWHRLPSITLDGSVLGGRVRVVGKAPPAAPVAPLSVSVVGHADAQTLVTPVPKGTSGAWVAPGPVTGTAHPAIALDGVPGARSITLRVTSRVTGTVTLSAVDIVATR